MANRESGFAIYESVFSLSDCRDMLVSIGQSVNKRSRAGARHLMSVPFVAAVANDARMIQIARQSLGDSAVPFRGTLFEKSPRSNWLVVWHQDTALPLATQFGESDWGPWSTKENTLYAHAPTWALQKVVALRLHLDESTSENGPLRVIPGSHLLGVLADDAVFAEASRQTPVECLVAAGGVIAMRPLLIHSSSKSVNAEPRRVLHIEYATALDLSPSIRLAIA